MGYLSSRRNVVGVLFGLLTLGAHFALIGIGVDGGLGFLAPVAVAGMYGIGALVAGRGRADLHVGSGAVDVEQLRRDLDGLKTRIRKYGGRLPGDIQQQARQLTTTLEAILQRGDTLAANSDALHVVSRTIRDYVPTSLETYLNLPRSFAMQRRDGRRSAHEELVSQMALLNTELTRIADAVFAGEAQSLENQGRFLEEKFRRSELDLN